MSSVSIIVIEKGGNIKELKVKSFDETELYKKGGFKSPTDFKQHNVWNQITLNNSTYNIHVYGKTVGRANQENKYEFPPPIDKTLFFGSCILVNKINNVPHNLTSKEWKSIYNQLYGGFEELSGDDSTDESIDPDENLPKTKSGYMKDDFIVDDDFEEEDSGNEAVTRKMYNSPKHNVERDASGQLIKEYDKENNRTSMINDEVRVYKGGSWKDRDYWLDPAQRRYFPQDMATDYIGFRCAMSRVGSKTTQPKRARH